MGLGLQLGIAHQLKMTTQLKQAITMLQMSAQDLRESIEKEYMENPLLELDYVEPKNSGTKQEIFDIPAREKTLESELLEQAEFIFKKDADAIRVAKYVIGSLNESGYLTAPLSEISRLSKVRISKVEQVLAIMQQFEPLGICARSLTECLTIQAKARGIFSGALQYLIQDGLQVLADEGIETLAYGGNYSLQELQKAVDSLKQLNPRPACGYDNGHSSRYITPDVYVEKIEDSYVVVMNDAYVPIPRLAVDDFSHVEIDEGEKAYLQRKMAEAKWLIRSLAQRRKNIVNTMSYIVANQLEFIEKGELYLRPMSMAEVAAGIGVHESTISRVAANKYVELPWGIFPFRKMFSANVRYKKQSVINVSVAKIKSAIQEIINGENQQKPLSDNKIHAKLADMGIFIARRTVLKYREQLGIAASSKRKCGF